MKKVLSIALCITLLSVMLMSEVQVSEAAYTEGDYEYSVENGKATITKYTGSGGSVIIPEQLGGYPVTIIENGVFYAKAIQSLVIPESITSIEDGGLVGGVGLKTIIVDEENPNYRSIDNVVFSKDKTELIHCASSSKTGAYVIPSGVISIKLGAFYDCLGITDIIIPNSVTTIGAGAFYHTSIKSIVIPKNVTTVEDVGFSHCHNLKKVYYMGDVPEFSYNEPLFSSKFTIYYLNGKSGWTTPEWNGYATVGLTKFFDKGDVNEDGIIDLSDAQMTLQCALGIIEFENLQLLAADVNNDGTINLSDANIILKASLNIISLED